MRRALKIFTLMLISAPIPFLAMGSPPQDSAGTDEGLSYGKLIPATSTMVRAWDIPRNPLTDSTLDGTSRGAMVRRGFQLFMQTPTEAPRFTANQLSCSNCHLNAGQREQALPLVGVSHVFPEFNKRSGRLFSLKAKRKRNRRSNASRGTRSLQLVSRHNGGRSSRARDVHQLDLRQC